jgi:hypothetical protein
LQASRDPIENDDIDVDDECLVQAVEALSENAHKLNYKDAFESLLAADVALRKGQPLPKALSAKM